MTGQNLPTVVINLEVSNQYEKESIECKKAA